MYEIEYKVEISEVEKGQLINLFLKNNFVKKVEVLQGDYYVEAKESPYGGFDLKRYRSEGHKFFYTEKVWEDVNNKKFRRETEKEISVEEFNEALKKSHIVIKIEKTRQSFAGTYKNREMHIDMDDVKFNHSPGIRHFVEAEIITSNKDELKTLKQSIIDFLAKSLEREVSESPGMFTMAFKKL